MTDPVGMAANAAAQVDLHDGPFGLPCAFLPSFVNTADTSTGDAIDAARQTADANAEGVEMSADDVKDLKVLVDY